MYAIAAGLNLVCALAISMQHAYHDFSYFYINADCLARRDGSHQMYIFAIENLLLPLLINWGGGGEIVLWAQAIFAVARIYDFLQNLPYFNRSVCCYYFQLNVMHGILVVVSLFLNYASLQQQ